MDLYVQVKISESQAKSQQNFANAVSTIFNERLKQCEQRKYHKLPAIFNTTLEFLVRINFVSIDAFKKRVQAKLSGIGVEVETLT